MPSGCRNVGANGQVSKEEPSKISPPISMKFDGTGSVFRLVALSGPLLKVKYPTHEFDYIHVPITVRPVAIDCEHTVVGKDLTPKVYGATLIVVP